MGVMHLLCSRKLEKLTVDISLMVKSDGLAMPLLQITLLYGHAIKMRETKFKDFWLLKGLMACGLKRSMVKWQLGLP